MRRAEAGIQVDKFYPPTDWLDSNSQQIDIRKNAENNTIVLLVGHSADFSKYSLLGLLAQVSSGTYDVYIDDVLVGSAVTSNTQYDIDFSTIATSYGTATTPEALVLHKVVIKPTTSGEKITKFRCIRTTGVTTAQRQGLLWCHLELSEINIDELIASTNGYYYNNIFVALSCKGIALDVREIRRSFAFANNLESLPIFNFGTLPKNIGEVLRANDTGNYSKIKRVKLEDVEIDGTFIFVSQIIEQISIRNTKHKAINKNSTYANNKNLKMILKADYSTTTNLNNYLTNAISLFPTKLDVSKAIGLTIIGTYGTSTYPMRGLRGLKVSNEAPFSGSSPQIDVSYTGLDRNALVELFQSLPTVTGSQTLKCVGATGNNLTKVGSPTIDENGVATNIVSGNYFRCDSIIGNNWKQVEFNIVASFESLGSGHYGAFFGNTSYLLFRIENKKFSVWYKKQSSDAWNNKTIDVVLEENVLYRVNLKINKNGLFIFSIYQNDTLFGKIEFEDKDKIPNFIYNQSLRLLLGNVVFVSTDLEQNYIKVDNNFFMKGYLTDNDKNIALNKGWALTLS